MPKYVEPRKKFRRQMRSAPPLWVNPDLALPEPDDLAWMLKTPMTSHDAEITDERQAHILGLLRMGNLLADACLASGTDYNAVKDWLRQATRERRAGRYDQHAPHHRFLDAVEQATASPRMRALYSVHRAIPFSPKMAVWFLTHSAGSRDDWKLAPQDSNVTLGGAVSIDVQARVEEYAARLPAADLQQDVTQVSKLLDLFEQDDGVFAAKSS